MGEKLENAGNKTWAAVGKIVTGYMVIALLGFGTAALTKLVWTRIAVGMFGAPAITYWTCYWLHWVIASMFKAILRESN